MSFRVIIIPVILLIVLLEKSTGGYTLQSKGINSCFMQIISEQESLVIKTIEHIKRAVLIG